MKLPENDQEYLGDENAKTKKSPWFLVVLLLLLSLILVGLIYWYNLTTPETLTESQPTRPTPEMNQEPETNNAVAEVEGFGAMSTSDEINAIEADLESTGLENLETELLQIEAELEATN